MRALIFIAALAGCGSLRTKNHVATGALAGMLACDYGQTVTAMRAGGTEHNPALGTAPSTSQLTAYFLAAGVALWASTNAPEWARSSAYAMALIGQSAMVLGNRYLADNGTWCGI